jgi:hypothetical protein
MAYAERFPGISASSQILALDRPSATPPRGLPVPAFCLGT